VRTPAKHAQSTRRRSCDDAAHAPPAAEGGKETVVVVDGLSEAEFGAKLESLMKG